MFNIAICDDEDIICSQIEKIVMEYATASCNEIVISVFNSGKRLCNSLECGEWFDLIFLDIEMDDYDGIETGKAIRTVLNNQLTHIIFISWKDTYCKQLFDIRPSNFLQKPLTKNQIIKEILFLQSMKAQNQQMYSFKIGQETYKVPFADIISFESQNKKIIITTIKCEYQFYDTIDHVFTTAKSHRFIRIHKSCIVNYLHVAKFSYDEVILTNSRILSISQSRRKEVRAIQISFEKDDIINAGI